MSNLDDGVNFSLSSLEDFQSPALAKSVLEALLAAPSFLIPKKYGREQPLKAHVDKNDLSPLIDLWLPASTKPDSGSITFPSGLLLLEFALRGEYIVQWKRDSTPSFAGLACSVPWEVIRESEPRFEEFLSFVKRLVPLVNPVYGDLQNMSFPGWDLPLDLRMRLPNVPWLSIYGKPYIELFGESRILSAPFYKIERLPSGHFILQATESILEPVSESVRSAIRGHLGEDAFMSGGKWRYKHGKAPQFDFFNLTDQ